MDVQRYIYMAPTNKPIDVNYIVSTYLIYTIILYIASPFIETTFFGFYFLIFLNNFCPYIACQVRFMSRH